tara:strand:+ start:1199 stop:1777 length:579 start_codon:yes stop_codon:yes gene_type:complete
MLNKGNSNDLHNVVFQMRQDGDWNDVHLDNLMEDKTIVVFGLPGAFTPTCSTFQLPTFEEMYDQFMESGVDEVYCTSVNDTFVMNAWFESLGIKNVKPLPDGNGDLARQLGLLVRKENLGFGLRSWRYAMLVSEGTVELLSIEPNLQDNCKTDPYEKSKPEVFLEEVRDHFGLNFVNSDSEEEITESNEEDK